VQGRRFRPETNRNGGLTACLPTHASLQKLPPCRQVGRREEKQGDEQEGRQTDRENEAQTHPRLIMCMPDVLRLPACLTDSLPACLPALCMTATLP